MISLFLHVSRVFNHLGGESHVLAIKRCIRLVGISAFIEIEKDFRFSKPLIPFL